MYIFPCKNIVNAPMFKSELMSLQIEIDAVGFCN